MLPGATESRGLDSCVRITAVVEQQLHDFWVSPARCCAYLADVHHGGALQDHGIHIVQHEIVGLQVALCNRMEGYLT